MSWETVEFRGLYDTPSKNGLTRPAKVRGAGYKMINMGELFAHSHIRDIAMERVPMNERELDAMLVQEGDLLFARQSLVLAGAGKCSIVREVYEPTTFESHIIRVRLNQARADPLFYYYYFSWPACGIRSIVTQGVQAGIRASDLQQLRVRRPRIEQQQRIASLLSRYDDLIENNRRRIELLEQSSRELFTEWFRRLRFPGHEHLPIVYGVPQGWTSQQLGDVADTNQSNYGKSNLPDNINYVDIASVTEGRILRKTAMSAPEAPGRARRIAKDGDTIWSNVRPNLRAFALVLEPEQNDVFSTGFTILSPKTVPFTFLYQFVTTDSFVAHLVNHTTGASYPAVRPPDFERAQVLVPTPALLAQFHELVEPNYRLLALLERENRRLAQARDLLLPRLMSGELAA